MATATAFNENSLQATRLFEEIIWSPNLVALWSLNESNKTTVYDRCLVTSPGDGTLIGSPTQSVLLYTTYGITFNGSNQYISLGNLSKLNFDHNSPFSLLCFYNNNNAGATETSIIGKWSGTSLTNGVGWLWSTTGGDGVQRLTLCNTHTTHELNVNGAFGLSNGINTLIGATYDGSGNIVLYAGGLVDTPTSNYNSLTTQSILNSTEVEIAAVNNGSMLCSGSIAFLAIWNKVVSAQDMNKYYTLGLG